jgi:exonuclease SbcC
MPYRGEDNELSFEGIRTLCISGNNGSGKSALIDGITWALWGKSRAKSDDDLICQGESEMSVIFDFTVAKVDYRVVRKHALPKKRSSSGQSSLDFFLISDEKLKSLSGETKAQTQQKIISTLHMDYETFINSAYLRQGHADEFTKATPAQRKDILGRILGLDLYDRLEERAREKERALDAERTSLEMFIRSVDDDLKRQDELEANLKAAEERLVQIDKNLEEKEEVLKGLEKEAEELKRVKKRSDETGYEIERLEKDKVRWQRSAEGHAQKIKEYQNILQKREEITQGYEAYRDASQKLESFNKQLRNLLDLKDRKITLEKAIETAQRELLNARELTRGRIEELTKQAESAPAYQTALRDLEVQEEELKEKRVILEERKRHLDELNDELARLAFSEKRLRKELAELDEKINLFSESSGRCPLCESELGEEGLKTIKEKYLKEKEEKTTLLHRTLDELAAKKEEVRADKEELSLLEKMLADEQAKINAKEGGLRELLRKAIDASKKLDDERSELDGIEGHLARRDFALSEQSLLTKIEETITELGYNREEHERIKGKLDELKRFEMERYKLQEAEANLEKEKSALNECLEAVEEIARRLTMVNEEQKKCQIALERLPDITIKLAQAQQEFEKVEFEYKSSQTILFTLKAQLSHLEEQKALKQAKKEELIKVIREVNIYNELVRAFGKNGIQAMLIESAIPEVENEANRLLAHMTDNRLHLSLDLKRPSKKGDDIETLDINVSDELDTRPYQQFSGGEAFRINFALRIALSRLLTRRSGAPLPTIIIDEGFGTQDSTGIEKMKEAIASIEDEFEKIIVITHMEELKDAFPVSLEVIKHPQGSQFVLS